MNLLFLLAFLLMVIFSACLVLLKRKRPHPTDDPEWKYVPRKLLTRPEQIAYFRLVEALPDCEVFAQVALSRVVAVSSQARSRAGRNRISQHSLDFVICSRDTTVLAVVEIDDRSHERPDRMKNDATKDGVLAAAGICLLRWRATALPTVDAIRLVFNPTPLVAQQAA